MPSKTANYRKRLKESDPEKYAEYLLQQRERNKRNRDARKERFESEPQTRALLQEKEAFREKERIRWRRFAEKKKQSAQVSTRATLNSSRVHALNSSQTQTPAKRPKDMTPAELLEHKRLLRAKSRKNQSSQKSAWRKRKDREYRRKRRAEQAAIRQSPAQGAVHQHARDLDASQMFIPGQGSGSVPGGDEIAQGPSDEVASSPVKKSEYHLVSQIRKRMSKARTPSKFARLVKNLIVHTRSPNKKRALNRIVLVPRVVAGVKRRLFSENKRKTRSDALSKQHGQRVKMFYLREDISRPLPNKRYATKKHGATHVMQQTLKAAHEIFCAENPDIKIGYILFTKYRPKNVRKISSTFLDSCQCVYCLNIRLKVLALNRVVRISQQDCSMRLDGERAIFNLVLCPKESSFHRPECVQGTCRACGNVRERVMDHYAALLEVNPTVTWNRWSRTSTTTSRQPEVKTAPVEVLLEELVEDIEKPAKKTSFVAHLFTADWQHGQYRRLKDSLKEGQLILVMDFAENKKSQYQDEIKSAHFSKGQFSLHPIVGFYRNDGELVRHSLNIVSDDIQHDFHAVHMFTSTALQHFQSLGIIRQDSEIIIFSDNCAAQYKNKGVFADLASYGYSVQRVYYGAEHGKGEADGETGVISKAVDCAVLCRQLIIRGAEDFFDWCNSNLTKDAPSSKRQFKFIARGDIQRHRPEAEVQPVTGCQKLHQFMQVAPRTIKTRKLACFCPCCLNKHFEDCPNKAYTGLFKIHILKGLEPSDQADVSLPASPPSPAPVPREDFFEQCQQELLRARRNGFPSFVAAAQNCLHEARRYPLPFPLMEPEFEKFNKVDEAAEAQRPAGAAPSDHFALSVPADGNCLPYALSCAAFGTLGHHLELRVRIVCELAVRKTEYLSAEYISRGTTLDGLNSLRFYHQCGDFFGVQDMETALECEIMSCIQNFKDMGVWQLLAAANVLGSNIRSIYPDLGREADALRCQVHKAFVPDNADHWPLYIQWTSNNESTLDVMWQANHFVPVVKDRCFMASSSIQIGDYVMKTFTSCRRELTYRALVIDPPENVKPDMQAGDVVIKYLRRTGSFYVFPAIDDISIVSLREVTKTPHPTINSRGHHFF